MIRIFPRLCALVSLISLCVGGCQGPGSRSVRVVELAPMRFEFEGPKIARTVELCLPPALRMRQWNVEDHGYIVDLGSRAALNVEIMAKAAFEEVVVSFDAECGSATDYPWFLAAIVSANRDWEGFQPSEPIDTSITMAFELVSDEGRPIWSTTTKGEVRRPGALPFGRKRAGAEDFGEALRKALDLGFAELMRAEKVREAIDG